MTFIAYSLKLTFTNIGESHRITVKKKRWRVGGLVGPPIWKICASQIGSMKPQFSGWKWKNLWNHHLQVIQSALFIPSWRSLNPLKRSLNHHKKVTLNHQAGWFPTCQTPSSEIVRCKLVPKQSWLQLFLTTNPKHSTWKTPPRRLTTAGSWNTQAEKGGIYLSKLPISGRMCGRFHKNQYNHPKFNMETWSHDAFE